MAEHLPDECLIEIFAFLSLRDQLNCQLVCRKWFHSVNLSLSKLHNLNVIKDVKWSTEQFLRFPHAHCEYCDQISINCLDRRDVLNKLALLSSYTSKNLNRISFDGDCNLTALITQEIISALQSFYPNLISLEVAKCIMDDNALEFLSDFPNLEELYFDGSTMNSDSSLKSCIEIFVQKSRKLQLLSLINVDIGFEFNSISLVGLNLKKVTLTNSQLQHICQHCPNITTLSFNQCYDLTDFSSLSACKNLHSLSVLYCNITDWCLIDISSKCQQLQRLRLELCPVKDYIILANLKNLHSLHVGPSAFITIEALRNVFRHCSLTNLKLRRITIDRNVLTNLIVANCSKLQRLSFSDIDINDSHLWQILTSCSSLRHLSINRTQVTANFLLHLHTMDKITLKSLNYSKNCGKISEKILIAFASARLLKFQRQELQKFDLRFKHSYDFKKRLSIYHDLFAQARLKISDKLEDDFKF